MLREASDGTHLYAVLATNLLSSLPNRQIEMSIETERRVAMLTYNKPHDQVTMWPNSRFEIDRAITALHPRVELTHSRLTKQ